MSARAFRWAKAEVRARNDPKSPRYDPLPTPSVLLLLMLADHYNDDWHRAWPGQGALAVELGCEVKTVVRATQRLRQAGLVETEAWVLNDGARRLSQRYLLPRFAPKVRAASVQPVVASVWSSMDATFDGALQVPGTNIYVEDSQLD